MFCTSCGKKISSGAEFCTECGKKFSGGGNATQEKKRPRYFWIFRIIKWIGYPILFFLMFLASGIDVYYFQKSPLIAELILAGLLLVALILILQKYVKLFRYAAMGLLTLSVLAGVALLGLAGYHYLIQGPSSLKVTVFKGPVSGATVNIYALKDNGDKGELIKGPLASDASGNATFDLPSNLPKRFFIESKGGLIQERSYRPDSPTGRH